MHYLGECGKIQRIRKRKVGRIVQNLFAKIVEMYKIIGIFAKIVAKILSKC